LGAEDLAQTSQEDLLRSFQIFVSGVVGDFARSLQQHELGAYSDMGYQQSSLYLSDEEFEQFSQALRATLQPWLAYQAEPGRRMGAS